MEMKKKRSFYRLRPHPPREKKKTQREHLFAYKSKVKVNIPTEYFTVLGSVTRPLNKSEAGVHNLTGN